MNVRIRVIGGPWPERIGCEGHIVDDPGDRVYPFDKPLKSERVIKLDNDPLALPCEHFAERYWTCVLGAKDIEPCGDRGI